MSALEAIVKRRLNFLERSAIPSAMSEDPATPGGGPKMAEKLTREERLAAKLRENLRRRKAQARALAQDDSRKTVPSGDAARDDDSGRLPKTLPES